MPEDPLGVAGGNKVWVAPTLPVNTKNPEGTQQIIKLTVHSGRTIITTTENGLRMHVCNDLLTQPSAR